MPLIFNALDTPVSVQVAGNWFEFKPKQVKLIHSPEIAARISEAKADHGLVAVPDICLEDKDSAEAKKLIAEATEIGIKNRVQALKRVVYNLEVGLRRDLEMKGIKGVEVDAFATDGEVSAMRELAKLKDRKDNTEQKKLDEIKTLREKIKEDK